jgi:ubiquinone/menaquinone biosynthesis C-methylase UbiE
MKNVDYDTISQVYDSSRVANSETIKNLIGLLRLDSDSVILDMGCGTGNYSAALQGVAKQVIGIDKSQAMIDQALLKYPTLKLIKGDVTDLPYKTDTFDGCFAIDVLHHVGQKSKFIQEAYRILRKGGRLAIRHCSHNQLKAMWYYHYFPRGLEVDLARLPDSPVIVSLLEQAGFLNIGIKICYYDEVIERENPEDYLNRAYRDSISTFAYLSIKDIEAGCKQIYFDIMSGDMREFVRKSKETLLKKIGTSAIVYGQK